MNSFSLIITFNYATVYNSLKKIKYMTFRYRFWIKKEINLTKEVVSLPVSR